MKYNLNIDSAVGKDALTPGMYPVIIYHLIRQYSNENNKLSIDDIYDTIAEYWKGDASKSSSKTNLQKTLKRNLEPLLYFDTKIHAEYKTGEEFFVDSGDSIGKIKYLWYEQEITPTDVQLLSDAVVYSKHLDNNYSIELLEKIMLSAGQSADQNTKWFQNTLKDADDISIPVPGDLYIKLGYVNDAIQNKRSLAFDFTFTGPKGEKYKVDSYSGVSPYKIIHENGIYFLFAAKKSPKNSEPISEGIKAQNPIIFLEIHKLDKIRFDDKPFINIEETAGGGKTLQEIISAGHRTDTHEVIPYKYKGDLILRVNSRGLDKLIDHFGNRMKITRRKELDENYTGSTPELAYTYDVTIKNAARNDWYELLVLLLRYPASEIELVSPIHLLQSVMFQMRNRLYRLGEKITIKYTRESSS